MYTKRIVKYSGSQQNSQLYTFLIVVSLKEYQYIDTRGIKYLYQNDVQKYKIKQYQNALWGPNKV